MCRSGPLMYLNELLVLKPKPVVMCLIDLVLIRDRRAAALMDVFFVWNLGAATLMDLDFVRNLGATALTAQDHQVRCS